MAEHPDHLIKLLEKHMATIEDQITAQTGVLNQILTAVQALSPAKAEDLTPVTAAITALQTDVDGIKGTVNAIAAKLPVDAPAG
jgi:hypothetical protein